MEKTAVEKYRERRDKRLAERGYRADVEGEEKKGGGHGNTRLPFGLCARYGIKVGSDWSPRDAWDALAGKGISVADAYSRASARKGSSFKAGNSTFRNPYGKKTSGGYDLYGDFDAHVFGGGGAKKLEKDAKVESFMNKDALYSYLKYKGVTKFKDPDTGERVNPSKMDLPKIQGKKDGLQYKDIVLSGLKEDYTRGPGKFVLSGTDFAGKRHGLGKYYSIGEVKRALRNMYSNPQNVKMVRDGEKESDAKKYMSEKYS